MPKKFVWTEGQDTQIRRLRTEGASWDVIALALGLARWTVIEHAPLPAGHRVSWGAITDGTCLEGTGFVVPEAIR